MNPRVHELLADRATEGLTAEEQRELEQLGAAGDESYDLAAAAADVATLDIQAMPTVIAGRVLARVGGATVTPIRKKSGNRAQTFAVIAAAAAIVLAIGAVVWSIAKPPRVATLPQPPSIAEQRAQLLAAGGDVTTLAWTATEDPNAKGAGGDVVWSASKQQGFMRFVGLTPNDRTAIQYQLWIFDASRDAAFPVDGGVFDVSATGEVIVPIVPKLRVDKVALFAVTVEKPGGVVVSKRERIVVTAKPA